MNESNDLAVGQIRRTGMGDYAEILAIDGDEAWVKFSKPSGNGTGTRRKAYLCSAVARWTLAVPPRVPDQRPELMFVVYRVTEKDNLQVIRVLSPEFTPNCTQILRKELQRPGILVQAIRIHASSVGTDWYNMESFFEDDWDDDLEE